MPTWVTDNPDKESTPAAAAKPTAKTEVAAKQDAPAQAIAQAQADDPEPETIPEEFADRKFYPHNPNITLMRTTPDECRRLGETEPAKQTQSFRRRHPHADPPALGKFSR